MKRMIFSIAALAVVAVCAQEEFEQTGTRAILSVKDKKIPVYLQKMEGGKLTFQPSKSLRDITVPGSRVAGLKFPVKFDDEKIKTSFNGGQYDDVISAVEPLVADVVQYMPIPNNLQEAYYLMFQSYIRKGDFAKVRENADIVISIEDDSYTEMAKVGLALAAIKDGDYETVEKIRGELDSEAASLYLKASADRAQEKLKDAMLSVTTIIAEHADDTAWLPESELLSSHIYLEMISTNSAITTNSALYTARQVKNMYGGSCVAADAEKFWNSLGGQAAEDAIKAAEEAAETEAAAEAETAEEEAAEETAEEETVLEDETGTNSVPDDVSVDTNETTESE